MMRRAERAAGFAARAVWPGALLALLIGLIQIARGFPFHDHRLRPIDYQLVNLYLGITYPLLVITQFLRWRARRGLRQLPPSDRVAALRELENDPRPEMKQLLKPLLKKISRPGREAAPAPPPPGSGHEALPAE
jgi:hypothetical protein